MITDQKDSKIQACSDKIVGTTTFLFQLVFSIGGSVTAGLGIYDTMQVHIQRILIIILPTHGYKFYPKLLELTGQETQQTTKITMFLCFMLCARSRLGSFVLGVMLHQSIGCLLIYISKPFVICARSTSYFSREKKNKNI